MNPLTKEEFLEKLKTDRDFKNKYGRKHITEGKQVLPPCHYGFQVYTRELSLEERVDIFNKKKESSEVIVPEFKSVGDMNAWTSKLLDEVIPTRAISLMWNQRSVDTFLGLPFNIASYGLLLEIIAKEVNMVPDELIGNLGDTHLYLDHIEQAKEQIGRELSLEERIRIYALREGQTYEEFVTNWDTEKQWLEDLSDTTIPTQTREPFPLPTLNIKLHFNNEPSFVPEYWLVDDFEIIDYKSHPAIKAPLSN